MNAKIIERYKFWNVYDKLPEGWVIDNVNGAPKGRYVFITDNKSVLKGGKRALLLIKKNSK